MPKKNSGNRLPVGGLKKIQDGLLSGIPGIVLANKFGVNKATVSQIKTGLKRKGIKIPDKKAWPFSRWAHSDGTIHVRARVRNALINSPEKKTRKEFAADLNSNLGAVDKAIAEIKKDNSLLLRKGLKPFEIKLKTALKYDPGNPERVIKMRDYLLSGIPSAEIAKIFGVTETAVSLMKSRMKRKGVNVPSINPYPFTRWASLKGTIFVSARVRNALINSPEKKNC